MRAAPVQVSYLGYPGTLGTDYMDYLVADRVLVPEGSRRYYAEKIIYLPNSYQANDSTREIAAGKFTREEFGLPRAGIVFCCFNRSFKLMPATFDCWMRILKRVEGSVLWLTEGDQAAVAQLRQHASSQGVDDPRLVFAQPVESTAAHLARQRLADLFLDTQPFNAHTTASDALWAGLPVLTCAGRTLPSRVAASLLSAVGLPELITSSLTEYEELAVRLATSPAELGLLRQKLDRNRASAALFDTARFTRHLEDAYVQIYQRSQAGMAPDHILVGA
jgi:predicted O-linked N-acetylglucosamine transferase (SPINDLY family)